MRGMRRASLYGRLNGPALLQLQPGSLHLPAVQIQL